MSELLKRDQLNVFQILLTVHQTRNKLKTTIKFFVSITAYIYIKHCTDLSSGIIES